MISEVYLSRLRPNFSREFARWCQALPEDPTGVELIKLFLNSESFKIAIAAEAAEEPVHAAFAEFLDRTLPSAEFAEGPRPRKLLAYHAHVYPQPNESAEHQHYFERRARDALDGHAVKVIGWGTQELGPHPIDNLEFQFGPAQLDRVLGFLALHAADRSLLVHPFVDDDLFEHSIATLWWGKVLNLDFAKLDIRRARKC